MGSVRLRQLAWIGPTIAAEREKGSMDRLLLCPVDRKAMYLAKLLGNLLFIGVVEIVALPVYAALFNVPLFAEHRCRLSYSARWVLPPSVHCSRLWPLQRGRGSCCCRYSFFP